MPRWLSILLPLLFTAILGFSTWAATSIHAIKTAQAVQENTNRATSKQLNTQQAQIAVFQNLLGDIKGDLKAIKAILEERARNEN